MDSHRILLPKKFTYFFLEFDAIESVSQNDQIVYNYLRQRVLEYYQQRKIKQSLRSQQAMNYHSIYRYHSYQ
jgi:hypothetical protein